MPERMPLTPGATPNGPLGADARNGTASPAGSSLLFLREEQIRLAQDLMFFAYRDFTGAADVMTALVDQGYVAQAPGRNDRRQRLLTLTAAGQALERRLFERQRERLALAFREAGGPAVEGFRRVMRGVMDQAGRTYVDQAEAPLHPGARPHGGRTR